MTGEVTARITISTHALTWSATLNTLIVLGYFSFQLTRSRGARQSKTTTPTAKSYNFNSRAHVERDWICLTGFTRKI